MALALYRRYRPDTFDGVIGQDQVTIPLMRALDENKLTHAYLFSGPRGCGQNQFRTHSRALRQLRERPDLAPVRRMRKLQGPRHRRPRFHRRGGKSTPLRTTVVDDARELRERAGFAPARDRYKIFILDEAHMVTPQGFNALLKIVEEPPEHVMFIFATTRARQGESAPSVSRTHHYPFRLVPQEVMGPYLEQICEDEHIEAEPGVLRLAMRAGGGSVRGHPFCA